MHIYDSKYNTRLLLHSHEMEGVSDGVDPSNPPQSSPPAEQPPMDSPPEKNEDKKRCSNIRKLAQGTQESVKLMAEQLLLMQKNTNNYCSDNKGQVRSHISQSISKLNQFADFNILERRCLEVGENSLGQELDKEMNQVMQDAIDRLEELRTESCCHVSDVQKPEEFREIIDEYWNSFRHGWISIMQQSNDQLDRNSKEQLKDRLKKIRRELKGKSQNLDSVISKGACPNSISELKARFNVGLAILFQDHQKLMIENFFSLSGHRRDIIKLANAGTFNLRRLNEFIEKGNWHLIVINMAQIPAVSISIGMQALAELEREQQLNLPDEDRVETVQRVVRQGVMLPPSFRIKVNEFLVQATGQSLGDNPTDAEIERALNNSIPTALGNAQNEIAEFLKLVFKKRLQKMLGQNRGQESRRGYGLNNSMLQAIKQLSVQEIVMARAGQL